MHSRNINIMCICEGFYRGFFFLWLFFILLSLILLKMWFRTIQWLFLVSSSLWLISSCKANVHAGVVSLLPLVFLVFYKLNVLHITNSTKVQHQRRALFFILRYERHDRTYVIKKHRLAEEYLPLSFVESIITIGFAKLWPAVWHKLIETFCLLSI